MRKFFSAQFYVTHAPKFLGFGAGVLASAFAIIGAEVAFTGQGLSDFPPPPLPAAFID